jgi:hypothetical protein
VEDVGSIGIVKFPVGELMAERFTDLGPSDIVTVALKLDIDVVSEGRITPLMTLPVWLDPLR